MQLHMGKHAHTLEFRRGEARNTHESDNDFEKKSQIKLEKQWPVAFTKWCKQLPRILIKRLLTFIYLIQSFFFIFQVDTRIRNEKLEKYTRRTFVKFLW